MTKLISALFIFLIPGLVFADQSALVNKRPADLPEKVSFCRALDRMRVTLANDISYENFKTEIKNMKCLANPEFNNINGQEQILAKSSLDSSIIRVYGTLAFTREQSFQQLNLICGFSYQGHDTPPDTTNFQCKDSFSGKIISL